MKGIKGTARRKICAGVLSHHDMKPVEEYGHTVKRCSRCNTLSNRNAPQLVRFWNQVDKTTTPDGCWTWTGGYFKCGYGRTVYKGSVNNAHRVGWILINGDPGELYVLHKCDNRACVRPDHLFLGTQAENLQDCYTKGRNSQAKLTAAQVAEIRHLHKHGHANQELADRFGVKLPTIYHIVSGRTWGFLKSPLMQRG